jgi:predicted heme/steroid binding protein
MYVCYAGIIYDVSESRRWRSGLHEDLHFPGQDLTEEIKEAPHGAEVFLHPDIHYIGRLI